MLHFILCFFFGLDSDKHPAVLSWISREATNTNFIAFDLNQSGFEPSIYASQGQHANHYTTDAVLT
jgi:hypothetical protein